MKWESVPFVRKSGVSEMNKYGSVISGRAQVISRREKRELKKSFKKRENGTRGIKVGIESFRRIAVSDKYNHVWERGERYPHFKYMANKLQ